MNILIAGTVVFFITIMSIVMGLPYRYYIKLDKEQERARGTKPSPALAVGH